MSLLDDFNSLETKFDVFVEEYNQLSSGYDFKIHVSNKYLSEINTAISIDKLYYILNSHNFKQFPIFSYGNSGKSTPINIKVLNGLLTCISKIQKECVDLENDYTSYEKRTDKINKISEFFTKELIKYYSKSYLKDNEVSVSADFFCSDVLLYIVSKPKSEKCGTLQYKIYISKKVKK